MWHEHLVNILMLYTHYINIMDGNQVRQVVGKHLHTTWKYQLTNNAAFLGVPPPPELHETGTIWKHWNRATIYAETKCVHEQLTEIHVLECGLKNCKTWGPPSPRGYQPTKLVFIFAWRSNHPCYSHIISIHKLFIGVWYLTLQDSLLTLGACFQAWDESGSRRSRSSYLPFQAPTQLSVLELQIGDRKLGRTCERGN